MAELSTQFQMLRARLENSMSFPYTLLISSALASDGKRVCAQGLASCMAAAGHRTVFLDLDQDNPTFSGASRLSSLSIESVERGLRHDNATGFTTLAFASTKICEQASRQNVAELVSFLRTRFDAIIVESPELTESSAGLLFASACDAIVLTARAGRSVRRQDRAIVDLLEREGLALFGVVTVGAQTIKNYRARSSRTYTRPIAADIHGSRNADIPSSQTFVLNMGNTE